jgi:two-component system response regulator HydG
LPRVAERPAVYGAGADAEDVPDRANTRSAWPAPGELATLRRRVQSAAAQIAGGRHTAGVRLLRQAVGGLARRDAWIDATTGALALASALLGRGRTQAARSALDDARRFAGRGGRDELLIDVAVLAGEAWIDLARLDEAEATLTAAASAARAAGDGLRAAIATIGLARALFWRGRYADAASALGGPSDDWPAALRLRHALLQARIAVGQREFSRAMSLVNDASRTAGANSAAAQAATSCTAAFVHLAVGDLDAVGADAATAIAAARAGHDPLRAIRARLLLAEAERRRGRKPASLSRLQRLVARGAAPVTVKALCELVAALSSPAEAPDAIVRRHIGATGLEALRLFTPLPTGAAAYDPIVDDIVAILRACQTADDEVAVLKEVCGRVRQQLHAAAVACIAARSSSYEIVAGDGARIEAAIAERAVTSNITIAPHRAADRIEAAAPIHYAGGTIGALCARWTIGSPYELSRAPTVLAMAAAATAPVLSALLAHRARAAAPPLVGLLGVTAAMCELRQAAERAAAAPFAVLIDGESGSGKELVARAIHRAGSRRDRPFCTLNCAALPDDLIEAELFGHARGSFTGAVADHAGVFEEAHGGTVFLDEVGELSPRAQAKVLRVIQEGELRRIGETVSRRVDVRIVSATNRDLRQEVAAGRFRLDLLYRLDVIRISVPPLRERREDIAMLADHFWREATARIGSRATLAPATVAALARYDWPGNVRELQNVLASLAVRSPKRGVVPPTALPPQFGVSHAAGHWRLDAARRTFEERFVRAALVRSGGHRARAAEELGVTRQGLTKLMTRLGISSE